MRLLTHDSNGKVVLRTFDNDALPPYAILSHTWHTDSSQEVSFEELEADGVDSKAGYRKIQFCANQAVNDGLQYFWIDTCCIKKSSDPELSEAINSMFRWYQNSAKCYVYLPDVPTSQPGDNEELLQTFQNSRWFTRGWTLQELIAPKVVEFYAVDGSRLGDKSSLEAALHKVTGIATDALRGCHLSNFSTTDRFSWATRRQTHRPEDGAYSLLGIFDVSMPLIYGEGKEKAFRRLRVLVDEQKNFVLRGLPLAKGAAFDSYADENEPRCHPDTRKDLLRDIEIWTENPDAKCIYWLYGMAGTGKSTISRTVAISLAAKRVLSASFFFKRGEGDRSNASRFFTTIAHQLANKIPQLVPHIAKALENDASVIGKTVEIQCEELILTPLSAIWQRSSTEPKQAAIIIDALDECEEDSRRIQQILDLFSRFREVKGIDMRLFVTSRPELPVRLGFQKIDSSTHKDVALHDILEDMIDHDLRAVLASELEQVREENLLQAPWPTQDDLNALVGITRPLFIHAATVCRYISDRLLGSPRDLLDDILKFRGNSSTSDLSATYHPVLYQLVARRQKSHQEIVLHRFRLIVGTIISLFDPLPKSALAVLLNMPASHIDSILSCLHSVLRVPNKEPLPIQLFHLSFHDFLVDRDQCDPDFWIDERAAHARIATRCIEVMSGKEGLRQNICNLEYPGKLRSEVSSNTIDTCLPTELRYACTHWVNHLQQSGRSIHDNDEVDNFLQRHFLYLLEALSLLGKTSESVYMITTLQSLLSANQGLQYSAFLDDAKRFVLANRAGIDLAPLQVYPMLAFAPKNSIMRRIFQQHIPHWIKRVSGIRSEWTSQLMRLEGKRAFSETRAIIYSLDGKQIASVLHDGTMSLWNASTGELQWTFHRHYGLVNTIAFTPDSKQIVLVSWLETVFFWNAATGELQRTVRSCGDFGHAVVIAPGGGQIASAKYDGTVSLWNASTGELQRTIHRHYGLLDTIAFTPDSKQIVLASWDGTVSFWNAATGELQRTIELHNYSHNYSISVVAIAPDGMQIASGGRDCNICVWDATTGELQQTIKGHCGTVIAMAFSPDGRHIVSGSQDCTARLSDATTGDLKEIFKGHGGDVCAVTFSPDGKHVTSGSWDGTVRLWDTEADELQTSEEHSSRVMKVMFSPNGKQVASIAGYDTLRLWDSITGELQQTLKGYGRDNAVMFSPDSKHVAFGSIDDTIYVYNAATGQREQTIKGHGFLRPPALSTDGAQIASGTQSINEEGNYTLLRLWNTAAGELEWTIKGRGDSVLALKFYSDRRYPRPNHKNLSLYKNKSNNWLAVNGQNMMWLPPDIWPSCSAVHDDSIAIGCESGRVVCIEISLE